MRHQLADSRFDIELPFALCSFRTIDGRSPHLSLRRNEDVRHTHSKSDRVDKETHKLPPDDRRNRFNAVRNHLRCRGCLESNCNDVKIAAEELIAKNAKRLHESLAKRLSCITDA